MFRGHFFKGNPPNWFTSIETVTIYITSSTETYAMEEHAIAKKFDIHFQQQRPWQLPLDQTIPLENGVSFWRNSVTFLGERLSLQNTGDFNHKTVTNLDKVRIVPSFNEPTFWQIRHTLVYQPALKAPTIRLLRPRVNMSVRMNGIETSTLLACLTSAP